jgi:hypothetical protein
MTRLALPLVVTAAFSTGSVAWASCLKYEPAHVSLTGRVAIRQVFGPPGFGEDPAHDRKESQAFLELRAPICVEQGPDQYADTPEKGQRTITLVPGKQGVSFSGLGGKRVTIRGGLLHAVTGHYHTALGLRVTSSVDIQELQN